MENYNRTHPDDIQENRFTVWFRFPKVIFIIAFIAVQIGSIIISRFSESKYFCWVPYDEISHYSISVTVNGKLLSADEIENRYRRKPNDRENRDIHNLISILSQYESTYGKEDKARVVLTYSTNGHEAKAWIWEN